MRRTASPAITARPRTLPTTPPVMAPVLVDRDSLLAIVDAVVEGCEDFIAVFLDEGFLGGVFVDGVATFRYWLAS